MKPTPQQGYLLFADISGFTKYVAGTELQHSTEILKELLELIVSHLRPVLIIAGVDGDAVLAYASDTKLTRGETLLETIEAAYVAFRDRLEAIRRRTTCTCRACRAVSSLDLKFMAHYGRFVAQRHAEGHELTGLDVELVRQRHLKTQIGQVTGWRGYALFTEASLAHMGVRPRGLRQQTEWHEYIGDVQTHTLNLQERYDELTAARQLFISAEDADATLFFDFSAPPPVVWEWLNDPEKRIRWQAGRIWNAADRPAGRTGAGARNHCTHGKDELMETVLDWRPFDYFTVELVQAPMVARATMQLEPLNGGAATRLRHSLKLRLLLPSFVTRPLASFAIKDLKLNQMYGAMDRLMTEDLNTTMPPPPPTDSTN